MAWRFFVAVVVASCCLTVRAEENTLTERERQEGWQLLFDGKTTKGWTTVALEPLPASYVQDGALNPHPLHNDLIIYDKTFENFILTVDFKITPKCNSGVFVRIWPLKVRGNWDVAANGLEVAIDDTTTADYHDTGAIYDLVKPRVNAMKPVGQWNHLEVTCDRNLIKSVINGQTTAEINLDEWTTLNQRPDGSRHKFDLAYKDHPRTGYIGLQDHGGDCWFRNIKLRLLK